MILDRTLFQIGMLSGEPHTLDRRWWAPHGRHRVELEIINDSNRFRDLVAGSIPAASTISSGTS